VAYRDGKRFIVKADDLLTAFLSLEKEAIGAKNGHDALGRRLGTFLYTAKTRLSGSLLALGARDCES
jgi:hypothetical protein